MIFVGLPFISDEVLMLGKGRRGRECGNEEVRFGRGRASEGGVVGWGANGEETIEAVGSSRWC
jgi:hypothetical protein